MDQMKVQVYLLGPVSGLSWPFSYFVFAVKSA